MLVSIDTKTLCAAASVKEPGMTLSRILYYILTASHHVCVHLQYCDKYADFAGMSHVEEWKTKLCLAALMKAEVDLEMYRYFWYAEYQLADQNCTQLSEVQPLHDK